MVIGKLCKAGGGVGTQFLGPQTDHANRAIVTTYGGHLAVLLARHRGTRDVLLLLPDGLVAWFSRECL